MRVAQPKKVRAKGFLNKTAAFTAAFTLVFGPYVPVYAQEVTSPEPAPSQESSSEMPLTNEPEIGTGEPQQPDDLTESPAEEQVETIPDPEPVTEEPIDEIPLEEEPLEPQALMAMEGGAETSALKFKLPAQPMATVDQTTGALIYEYPIQLPAGRNGMTPELSLRYNSRNASRPDTLIGLGWEATIPFVVREPLDGTQNLYSKPYFSASMGGNLIATTNASTSAYTTYLPESDSGEYQKYTLNVDNSWSMTGKDGRTYHFGTSTASRQDNPSDSTKIYKWMLSKITDTQGNEIHYYYIKDGGQIYPSKIVYTYHASAAAVHTVQFNYSTPTNYGATVYNSAFAVTTSKLLSSITVTTTNGVQENVDTYTLVHTDAPGLKQKLLYYIDRTYAPPGYAFNQSGLTDMTTFTYSTKTAGWEQGTHSLQGHLTHSNDEIYKDIYTADFDRNSYPDVLISNRVSTTVVNTSFMLNSGTAFTSATSTWSLPSGDLSYRYAIADVNGDDLPDLLPRFEEVTETPPVYLNSGSDFDEDNSDTWYIRNYQSGISNCGPNVGDAISHNSRTFLYDIDHDGKNDIVYFGGSDGFAVHLNTGSGWATSTAYTFTESPGGDDFDEYCDQINNSQSLVDINGDGLEDYIHQVYGTYLNTGSGFAYSSAYTIDTEDMQRSGIGDINGDNLPDYIGFKTYSGNRCSRVHLNNGSGFTMVNPVTAPPCTNSSIWAPAELKYTDNSAARFGTLMDVNSDGFLDVIGASSSSVTGRVRALNDARNIWTVNSTSGDQWTPIITPGYGVFFDINTDGVTDFITPLTTWDGQAKAASMVYMGKANVPNKLTQIDTPLGARSVITYGTAETDLSDTDIAPTPVVKKISIENLGLSQPSMVSQYEYDGGSYIFDPIKGQRRFAGFNKVTLKESGSNLSTLRQTDTYFHQANGSTTDEPDDEDIQLIGKPYYSMVKDPSGTPKRETWLTYGTSTLATEPHTGRIAKFVYPATKVVKITDSATTTATAELYTYDSAVGERTEEHNLGFVSADSDGDFVDIGGDSRYRFNEYASNASTTLVKLSRTDLRTSTSPGDTVTRTEYRYDNETLGDIGSLGNLSKMTKWVSGDGSQVADTTYTYDSFGNTLTTVSPRFATTTYVYDATKTLIASSTNALGQTTNYEYLLGLLKKVTDPNGFSTDYSYSNYGWLYMTQTGSGAATRQVTQNIDQYISGKYAVRRQDNPVNVTHQTYELIDGLGRSVRDVAQKVNDASGTSYGYQLMKARTYDALGRQITDSAPVNSLAPSDYSDHVTTSVPSNLVSTTTYDVFDRPLSIQNALGSTTYSYAGSETTVVDPNGNQKKYIEDAYGNLVQVKEHDDSNVYTTSYAYDVRNLLTNIADALGNVRSFTYNNAGWNTTSEDLHASADATYGSYTYTYDLAGNKLTETMPNGTVIARSFDLLDRVTAIDSDSTGSTDYTFSHDSCTNGVGRVCSISGTLPNSVTLGKTFVYTKLGAVATTTLTTLGSTHTTQYFYGRSDIPKKVTYPNGVSVRTEYGEWLVPSALYVTLPGGAETAFATSTIHYTKSPSETRFFNGMKIGYNFDASKLYRLGSTTAAVGTTTLHNFNYAYDPAGNITSISEPSLYKAYSYDDLNRLTQALHGSGGATTTYSYAYDAIGNITSANGLSYTYSGAGKTNPHAATAIASSTHEYDDNGNVVTAPGLSLTFNWQNQPVSFAGTSTITATYDESGRRFLYQTPSCTEISVNESYINRCSAPEIAVKLGGLLIGHIASSTLYTTVADHLQTPRIQLNSAGSVSETATYDPFGKVISRSGSLDEKRGYINEMFDDDTGLSYLNARYYDGTRGQFLSQDPVFLTIGVDPRTDSFLRNPQLQNSYSYAMNNPIIYKDPTGEEPNKTQAATLDQLIESVKAVENRNQGAGYRNVVSAMATHFSSSNETPRFVYTESAGWLDMRHFATAAESMYKRGETLTRLGGIGVEVTQSLGADKGSAFSYEDLPSNSEGMGFAQFLKTQIKNDPKTSISNALGAYLKTLTPRSPKDAANYNSLMETAYDKPKGSSNSNSKNKTPKK